jgi:uncharacterized membrane protein YoaK (UPF0700 family)
MTEASAAIEHDFDPSLRERASHGITHPLARVLLVLTFTTGLVDAVSFLGLGRVFTANMTGNIVLLGFGIAGNTSLPVVAPLVSLGAFLAGAASGGVLAARMSHRHPAHITWALGVEVSAIGGAAVLAGTTGIQPGQIAADGMIALLAFAMGLRNATARRFGVPDLTTTVLTMTLTGLAADSPLAGGKGEESARRTIAVFAMLAGAMSGALMLKTSLVLPVAVAAGIALGILVLYLPAARRGA